MALINMLEQLEKSDIIRYNKYNMMKEAIMSLKPIMIFPKFDNMEIIDSIRNRKYSSLIV